MRRTTADRIRIVQKYYRYQTVAAVIQHWEGPDPPCTETIKNLIRRFEETGTVADLPRSGRPITTSTPENQDRVRDHFRLQPTRSVRQSTQDLMIPRTSLRKIVDQDYVERRSFAEWMIREHGHDPTFIDRIWFTDESKFSLDKTINTHNSYYYATENPHYHVEIPHSKLGVNIGKETRVVDSRKKKALNRKDSDKLSQHCFFVVKQCWFEMISEPFLVQCLEQSSPSVCSVSSSALPSAEGVMTNWGVVGESEEKSSRASSVVAERGGEMCGRGVVDFILFAASASRLSFPLFFPSLPDIDVSRPGAACPACRFDHRCIKSEIGTESNETKIRGVCGLACGGAIGEGGRWTQPAPIVRSLTDFRLVAKEVRIGNAHHERVVDIFCFCE
ncbi:hypothetical protein BLNAU_3316 [Blattamonas nauphoetae]|uniref:DUF4817 domain-containing protein n=1 Tax=Blattamonas nauphoetae TaxID=2049346 RepID=A0ABQ9YE66_9EUKA|nr:hypothetical protein BLNAU_3316 [Blattamonas nauphoetae]